MRRLRLRSARALTLLPALALGALVALGVAACGEPGEERAFIPGEAAREGIAVPLDGVDYEIFITRQLNLADPEDKQYYQGRAAPPGSALYGVFLQACAPEDAKGTQLASGRMHVVDIRGKEYRPLPVERDNVFAYQPGPLRPGECEPNQASATSYGPTGGSMVVFQIPVTATENRPFELEIEGRPAGPRKPPRVARFELDL
jgi:hypothetical protein